VGSGAAVHRGAAKGIPVAVLAEAPAAGARCGAFRGGEHPDPPTAGSVERSEQSSLNATVSTSLAIGTDRPYHLFERASVVTSRWTDAVLV